jgi:hypothetical protein
VKRPPLYEILFREMLKYTDSTHPDYKYLNEAYG